MQANNIRQAHVLKQSIWLDHIDRKLMNSGELQRLIEVDGIRGLTSNPAIFEKSISGGTDYREDISRLAVPGRNNEDVFYALAVSDIQRAADLFAPVYEEEVEGADGYVSLEVSPHFARDSARTLAQARELWATVNRKNVMIKIPGTLEGLEPFSTCISEGINVNVTLLFGLRRYEMVIDAYLAGLEKRLSEGLPIDRVASVASFFLSRIDVLADPLLEAKGLAKYKGRMAIALAKKAYAIYRTRFSSERFLRLREKGAVPQRLLWASTSSKDPAFPDTMYVDALIGPETVDTVPMETLKAYQDHGHPELTLDRGIVDAGVMLKEIEDAGIDSETISAQLEEEGIKKFNEPFDKLMQTIGALRVASGEPVPA